MRAELRGIDPNEYPGWDAFATAAQPNPWDRFGWFTLRIGPEGHEGSDYFQVLVATPAAVSRAQGNDTRFRGVIVPVFEPQVILDALREHVSAVIGSDWEQIAARLGQTMHWEYEGLYTHLERSA